MRWCLLDLVTWVTPTFACSCFITLETSDLSLFIAPVVHIWSFFFFFFD